MPNMSPKKAPMPSQDPNVRNKNFLEVATGYTEEVAIEEAQRCLNCKHRPCVNGCPVHIAIPDFIKEVAQGNFAGAYDVISQSSSLPAVCGRVCPQESQCESKCVRGIKTEPVGIGRLERFVADWHNAQTDVKVNKPESNGHKVAIVGSGPAGLTCAGDLAKKGYDVTVFEALHLAGGVLVYGSDFQSQSFRRKLTHSKSSALRLKQIWLSAEFSQLTSLWTITALSQYLSVRAQVFRDL
jgi:glutamate synthase (NADPH/NADH) small chain